MKIGDKVKCRCGCDARGVIVSIISKYYCNISWNDLDRNITSFNIGSLEVIEPKIAGHILTKIFK